MDTVAPIPESLAERGRSEEPIALLLEGGAPIIAAILGALKAGKVYVPLDPSMPRARIGYISPTVAGLALTILEHRVVGAGLTDLERS